MAFMWSGIVSHTCAICTVQLGLRVARQSDKTRESILQQQFMSENLI